MTDPSSQPTTALEPLAPTPTPSPVANDSSVSSSASPDPITPVANNNNLAAAVPPHTQTQSTLAPTSEYVRYLLLALPARYVPRGILGTLFEDKPYTGNRFARWTQSFFTGPREWLQKKFPHSTLENKSALAYNLTMGIGSLALTASYSWTVYKDAKNIFREAVAEENGKPAEKITFKDLQQSNNRIVQKTMENFWHRLFKRALTDVLFFPVAALRSTGLGDLMVGLKALQAFGETWKRKTTMFEDLITFINNKINPRNGLGQPISVGEIFDLYQHYAEAYQPDRMFNNVVERGTGEGSRWAESQPIFQRITELMNQTYAYKHRAVIDPTTGHAVHQAEFALPKFIYLLGHDLIDIRDPRRTLATIEIANRYGIQVVKTMQTMLQQGRSLEDVVARYPIPTIATEVKAADDEKNGVIAKGSTMQLERAEMGEASAAPHTPHVAKIPENAVHRVHHTGPVHHVNHDGTLLHAAPALSQ